MKKIYKTILIILVILLAFFIIIPIVYKGKIIDLVKQTANNNLNATLDFKDANLSIWSSFPSLGINLKETSIVNKAPFEGDTLFKASSIDLKMPFKEIFKNESDGINITSFIVDKAKITIVIDSSGNANYNITKHKKDERDERDENSKHSGSLNLVLKSYSITNSFISYNDVTSNLFLKLTNFNHSGRGNLSSSTSDLKTLTTSSVSLLKNSIAYLSNNSIQLDAIFRIDLINNKFSFLNNKANINKLPLVFEGFFKINKNNNEMKVSFKTPSSDFKNFLALIPEEYSKNIDGVKTTGNFDIKGNIEGIIDKKHVPTFSVLVNSDNASFKYPNLSKSLQNINIITEIGNKTGLAKDTYVFIDKLSFKIDNDVFSANAKITDVTKNMKVATNVNGIINLGNLKNVYPAESVKGLKGILNVKASTNFDMLSIEKKQYHHTNTSGVLKLSDFEYSTDYLKPLKVAQTTINLSDSVVKINDFNAQLGKTDFLANGIVHNFLGFLFNNENIEGKFNVSSDTFSVNDFMLAEIEKKDTPESSKKENIKIPSFLDFTIDAKANTVLYDDITLQDVTGTLIIKDQKVALRNMRSNVFDGAFGFNGEVSTKETIPSFNMDMDIKHFNIAESFKTLDLLKALAPIASVIDGKINSKISLSGNLKDDFTPDLNSLSGNLLAELLSSKITSEKAPLLQSLEQNLGFFDSKKFNLDHLKTAITFKDGKVAIKPFNLNYDDIEIVVSGGHNFDTSLAYNAVINVPAKYLGKEASQLIAQLNDEELNTIKIPVNALISGKFNKPNVNTDLKSAVTNLSKQLAKKKKNKLVEKGKEEITNALDGLLNGNKKEIDSTATDTIKQDVAKDVAKDILGNIFRKKKKKKDTVN